jgi:hypothetical protein
LTGMKQFSYVFLLLVLPLAVHAQNPDQVSFPVSARMLSMGGSSVALCDDPQAGFLNPAGLKFIKLIGYDLSYDGATEHFPDHYSLSLENPGTDKGTAFAMGGWIQGASEHRPQVYYVPWSGTCWMITNTTALGVVTRFPYMKSNVDSIKSRWETLADVTFLQTFEALHIGASVERVVGGGADIVPRRLHVGAAIVSDAGIVVSYEYRADEASHKFKFHFNTSRIGAEARVGEYVAFRAGYVTGAENRLAGGLAFGLLKEGGWRLESGWEWPTARRGFTRWSIGAGFRT